MRVTIYIIVGLLFLSACRSSKDLPLSLTSEASEKQDIEYLHRFIEGHKLKTLGYPSEAIMVFNKCLEINPEAPAVHYELAQIYLYNSELSQALIHAEKAAAFEPVREEWLLFYARLLWESEEKDAAIKAYEKLLKNFPNAENKFETAQLLSSSRKGAKRAIELYQEVEDELGIQEITSLSKERVYRALGKEKEAMEEVRLLADALPFEVKYRVLYAESLANLRLMREAESEYKKAFQVDSNYSLTSLSYSEFLLLSGRSKEAFPYIRKTMLDKDFDQKTKFKSLYKFSQYYANEIPLDSLITWSKLAIQENQPELQIFLGSLYLKNKQTTEARDTYRKILDQDQSSQDVWGIVLELGIDLSDWPLVFEDSKKAYELFPNNPWFYLVHAESAAQLKNWESGIKALKMGVLTIADDPKLEYQFYVWLGDMSFKVKDYEECDRAFDKAFRIDSTDASALNNYSYYLALQNTKLDLALKLTNRSNELKPDQPNYLDTKAWVLFRLKRYSEALLWINQAIEKSYLPSGAFYEHKGDILFFLGETDQALDNWQKAIEKGAANMILLKKIEEKKWLE